MVPLLTIHARQASADIFYLTSCELSGGCGTATQFGTVTLTSNPAGVKFDVVLTTGNLFVETGAGGKNLFLFNDSLSNSNVTNISATLGGVTVATIIGGLTGSTNLSPPISAAGGTGTFTASIACTNFSSCNGASGPNFDGLHFTVTNATLAELETKNASGNYFVADILCGQAGCTGKTGIVDGHTPATVPDGGSALVLLGGALVGLETLRRLTAASA